MKQFYFTELTDLTKFINFTNFTGAINLKELFSGSDFVRKYSFKTMIIGDSYALLAVINPILAATFEQLREKSALFQKRDCFECLSPHNTAA